MKLTREIKDFIALHSRDDVASLLLNAKKYPEFDMSFIAAQIQARRQIKDKLPLWYACDSLVFPSKVAAEQCSSEQTAVYKQRLVGEDVTLCDLTGGLGIDSYFFSLKVKLVTYVERFHEYCEAAQNNFDILQAGKIQVVESDSLDYLERISSVDVFYIDPARRGEGNKRVFALQDCEPDLVQIKPHLFEKAPLVIAKISPMADIRHTLSLLPETREVHVLSVKNECKELVFVMEREKTVSEAMVYCVNYTSSGMEQCFNFMFSAEQNTLSPVAHGLKQYLYEPNASILKAGAFKSIACRMGVEKLHISSHLYTSDTEVPDFPGRRFVVDEVIKFSGKHCSNLYRTIPQANITVRNFPLTVDEIRKRTKIKEGGEVYLFATTLGNDEKVLISCHKIN